MATTLNPSQNGRQALPSDMGTVALGSNVCSHKHLHRSTVPFAVFPGLPRRTFLMRTSMLCCNSKSALQHSSSPPSQLRSEEHTSELQSLMRISYAVFCLKQKKHTIKIINTT